MRVAVPVNDFGGWNGGVDFINNIVLSISSIADERDLDIYVLIPDEKIYKRYKGINKIRFKFYYAFKYFKNEFYITRNHENFPTIQNVSFVTYFDFFKTLKKLKIDFMFPHLNLDWFHLPVQSLGYLYDCQHKYYPEFFTQNEILRRDNLFNALIKHPIIVNAMSVKNDLIRFYNAKPDNIFVLPFTPKLNFLFLEDCQKNLKKYDLPKRYLMSSNQFWVHKDHPTLFKSFHQLIKDDRFKDVELVCTGYMEDHRRPEYINELKNLLKELEIEEKVHLLGVLPKIEQIEIMKGAIAVVQTTLFEGGPGGGSVYDAISLGIPCAISDIAPNLEIHNELVDFFKAQDVVDLTTKMKQIIDKPRRKYTKQELIEISISNQKKLGNFLIDTIERVKNNSEGNNERFYKKFYKKTLEKRER